MYRKIVVNSVPITGCFQFLVLGVIFFYSSSLYFEFLTIEMVNDFKLNIFYSKHYKAGGMI